MHPAFKVSVARELADLEAEQPVPRALPWGARMLDVTYIFPLIEEFDPDEDAGLGLLPHSDSDGTVNVLRQLGDELPDFD